MSLELRLGRAGTGKTNSMIRDIERHLQDKPLGPPIWLIVPTSVSYGAERQLLSRVPSSVRAEIVTLQRLAERANAELHVVPGTPINLTGKRLLLAEVFESSRNQLQVLGRDIPTIGFLDAILEVFAEFTSFQVPLSELESLFEVAAAAIAEFDSARAATVGTSLLGKLRDLCRLYVSWKHAIESSGRLDSDELMSALTPALADWPTLQGALLYIDGFAQLSPQELGFLLSMSEASAGSVMTLGIDPEWVPVTSGQPKIASLSRYLENSVWVPNGSGTSLAQLMARLEDMGRSDEVYAPQTLHLYGAIRDWCEARHVPVNVVALENQSDGVVAPSTSQSRDLALLQRRLFQSRQLPETFGNEHIRIFAAQNARVEMDGVARHICHLMQTEDVQFGDVLVLAPSVSKYAPYVRDSFERFDIPVYTNDFPSFGTYPLAKFLLASLQMVEENLSLESMVRILKTDFSGLNRSEADWLETYLRQFGISGMSTWVQQSDWRFATDESERPRDQETPDWRDRQADALRRRLVDTFSPWFESLQVESLTPGTVASELWGLLTRARARKIVAKWLINEGASQSPLEASLHEQAWQKTIAVLNDLWETLPTQPYPRAFLFQLVRNSVMTQALATIPAGLNEVLFTDFGHAAGIHAKVVFVVGLTDGTLPRRIHQHGLLQDDEREQFYSMFGLRIGYTVAERQQSERLTIYSVLSRATKQLVMSYPLATPEGKEMRPSAWIDKIRSFCTPGTLVEELWTSIDSVASLENVGPFTERTALDYVISVVQQASASHVEEETWEVVRAILQWFDRDEVQRNVLKRALRGFGHRIGAMDLPKALTAKLYGSPLKMNVYRLETFAACPFKHFAQYGLKLQPEETPDINPRAKGTLLHDTLLEFVKRHMEECDVWVAMSDAEVLTSLREAFEQVLSAPSSSRWTNRPLRIEQTWEVLRRAENAALLLTRHVRQGRFRPYAMELAFGDSELDVLPGFEMVLGEGASVIVRGRIDRVDLVEDGEQVGFRIIDYKSGNMSIDLSKVEAGLQLQLPVYAAIVEANSEKLFGRSVEAKGILYIPLLHQVELKNVPIDQTGARGAILKRLKAKGLMEGHPTTVGWFDRDLTSGSSDLFPKVYNKNGSFAKGAPILTPDEWRIFLARALAHIEQLSSRIVQGEIQVSPYRYKSETPCTFCAYSGLCHVEPRIQSDVFRRIENRDKDTLLEAWTEFGKEGNKV